MHDPKHNLHLFRFRVVLRTFVILLGVSLVSQSTQAQSVCLPAPRLLLTKPMGGQAGTTFEVTVSGQNLENVEELLFSHPGLTAVPKQDAAGLPVENIFVVSIAADCPLGIHEARVMSRLGVSSSRVFSVNDLTEVSQTAKNISLETAQELSVNSICNAAMTKQSIDYYKFQGKRGQRIAIDCAASGIDSKLTPVLIVADERGQDLLVERRGGALDFQVPDDGVYVIKVHDLTFSGDANHFYRLLIKELSATEPLQRLASTQAVHEFSWPPVGLSNDSIIRELEPNDFAEHSQKITLPCDIRGSFSPAADVDLFEFEAKAGDVWWVEVASERLGRPTDPTVLVQHIASTEGVETKIDVAELKDIGSPVKLSTVHYAYNGTPYNSGSTDVLGKLEIKTDGLHRLQLHDLFGGTRNDPNNIYRLIIRRAEPDFALIAWAMHMELRNGDRNALSKPMALRGGATIPFEVVVIRRDGFNGAIEIKMDNLPDGVSAAGLTIPEGQSQGTLLVTAEENAPRGYSKAKLTGHAMINEQSVERPIAVASMAWPVTNHWSEIPKPRLIADVPVSVGGSEQAPLSISAKEDKVWEVVAGEKLQIPLEMKIRCELSGKNVSLKTFGHGFDKNPAFEVPLSDAATNVTLDLAALKTLAGDYTIAFYGKAVAKYQYNPEAVITAESVLKQANDRVLSLKTEMESFATSEATISEEEKNRVTTELQSAEKAVVAAEKTLKTVTAQANPKDIVDIVASEPIRIRVLPKTE